MTEGINRLSELLKQGIPKYETILTCLQRQDYYHANMFLTEKLPQLEEILTLLVNNEKELTENGCVYTLEGMMAMLQELLSALTQKEYVLLGDYLQLSLLPFLYSVQEVIVKCYFSEPCIVESEKIRYHIEYTSCGLPTVLAKTGSESFYLHSNKNAMTEAYVLAGQIYERDVTQYLIYGMGLGYLAKALLECSEYIHVTVFESREELIRLAREYGPAEIFDSDRLTVVWDGDGSRFAGAVQENPGAGVGFFYPSVRLMDDESRREAMEDAFVGHMSEQTQYAAMCGNLAFNRCHYDALPDSLADIFTGRRVYLIAAGPSLDKNIEELKKAQKNGILVAVGTVLKKLLRHGIRPDYVVVSDAKANTFAQVQDLECAEIPLFGLATAYYRFFSEYPGKHYLVCQKDFEPAETLARSVHTFTIPTGGSVVTVALSLVLQLGVKEVVFVGLDLAFTDGRDHASDTAYEAKTGESGRMVEDVYGNPVMTGRNLDRYRRFVEQTIGEWKDVRFVDATEGGAKIHGTVIRKLRDMV